MTAPLRFLVVVPNLPWPTRGGADLRNWGNVQALTAHGAVAVFGMAHGDARASASPPGLLAWRNTTTAPPELAETRRRAAQ